MNQVFRNSHSSVFPKIGVFSRLAKSMESICGGVYFLLLKLIFAIGIYHRTFQRLLEQLFLWENSVDVGAVLKPILIEPRSVLHNRCPARAFKNTSLQNTCLQDTLGLLLLKSSDIAFDCLH